MIDRLRRLIGELRSRALASGQFQPASSTPKNFCCTFDRSSRRSVSAIRPAGKKLPVRALQYRRQLLDVLLDPVRGRQKLAHTCCSDSRAIASLPGEQRNLQRVAHDCPTLIGARESWLMNGNARDSLTLEVRACQSRVWCRGSLPLSRRRHRCQNPGQTETVVAESGNWTLP